jgi:galactokinase
MDKQVKQLAAEFQSRFEGRPRFFQAPGRVNVIGEHTDYNEGFVMPFAIDRQTFVAACKRKDSRLNVYASDLDETAAIDLRNEPRLQTGTWMDYVEGSVRCVAEKFSFEPAGADMIITSTVPIGAGLSSSAAIEIAVGFATLMLNDIRHDPEKLAFAGQMAEHKYVGIRSGIMDQFASVFGRRGTAMLLDCRSLERTYVGITDERETIVVIDTKVKHNLASSEYNTRRAECEAAVAILNKQVPEVRSLRDVTQQQLREHSGMLTERILKRARHVVSENQRTLDAAVAFRKADFESAGKLMIESHESLRDDYEVSCDELDFLVDVASESAGVFGSRMTGGGFGGCTVNLLRKDSVDEFRDTSVRLYTSRFGFEPDFYIFEAADGASEIDG